MDQNPIACIINFGNVIFQQIQNGDGGDLAQCSEAEADNVLVSVVAHRRLLRLVSDAPAQQLQSEQQEIPMSESDPKRTTKSGLSMSDIRMLTELPRLRGNPPTAEQIAASRLRNEGTSLLANDPRKLRPKPKVDRANLTRKYSASLKARDIERLTRIAEKERRPLSTLVRHIIEDWLADHETRHAARDGEGK